MEYGELFEGDMDLNDDQVNAIFGYRNALIQENYRWPNATVLYMLSNEHSHAENKMILDAMRTIESVSCIRFRKRINETDYVQFKVSIPYNSTYCVISIIFFILHLIYNSFFKG